MTTSSITIAVLGWAKLSLQQREGSGYNLVASDLAAGLAARGHRVHYLRSGMHYELRPGMRIRPVETWRGVSCHDLLNSPNLCPALANFGNLPAEIESPQQVGRVLEWLDRIDADLVHVHSLEGFSLDTLAAIRASHRPVIVTLHNYWFLCPQVDLLCGERELCLDYAGGMRCTGCMPRAHVSRARWRRRLRQAGDRSIGSDAVDAGRALLGALGSRVRFRRKAASGGPLDELPARDGETQRGGYDSVTPVNEPWRPRPAPMDANERFLEAHHRAAANAYGDRRLAGVRALNAASLVTAPSDFLRRAHVAAGVDEERTRVVRLGLPHTDLIHRRSRESPYYATRPWDPKTARRPLRLAFFGTTRNNKGLVTLVHSIPLLEPEVRQRCQFLIRAQGADGPLRAWLGRYPEVQFAGGYDFQHLVAAWGEYDVGVLCHLWFENSPLVLLEHLHGGKFVLTPRLGGPVEWIDPPSNGLFFPAGDSEGLADCIRRLVRGDVAIPSPSEVHAATVLCGYPDHLRELESLYSQVLERG